MKPIKPPGHLLIKPERHENGTSAPQLLPHRINQRADAVNGNDDFLCPACGLESHVSGGEDRGMIAATTTIYCETCQTLQDALMAEELYANPPKEIAPRCEKRKSHPIKLWSRDQPCPRCGQALLKEDPNGIAIMWD